MVVAFLVDECVGVSVVLWLRNQGYYVFSIEEECPGVKDSDVLSFALKHELIILTVDKDFGELVFKYKSRHCGILLLRLADERPNKKIALLSEVLKLYVSVLRYNFLVATENGVRIIRMINEKSLD